MIPGSALFVCFAVDLLYSCCVLVHAFDSVGWGSLGLHFPSAGFFQFQRIFLYFGVWVGFPLHWVRGRRVGVMYQTCLTLISIDVNFAEAALRALHFWVELAVPHWFTYLFHCTLYYITRPSELFWVRFCPKVLLFNLRL